MDILTNTYTRIFYIYLGVSLDTECGGGPFSPIFHVCDAHKFVLGAPKSLDHRKQKLARSTSCFRNPGIETKKLSWYLLSLRIRKLNLKRYRASIWLWDFGDQFQRRTLKFCNFREIRSRKISLDREKKKVSTLKKEKKWVTYKAVELTETSR